MSWLWQDIEGPREMPDWAYRYLITTLKVEPDRLTRLECVEQLTFRDGVLVTLIRLYDRYAVPEGISIKDFTSLDHHPELILYEGYIEKASGKVHITGKVAPDQGKNPSVP